MTPEQMVAEELIRAAAEALKRNLEGALKGDHASDRLARQRLMKILRESPSVRVHLAVTIGHGAVPVATNAVVFVNMPPGILSEEQHRMNYDPNKQLKKARAKMHAAEQAECGELPDTVNRLYKEAAHIFWELDIFVMTSGELPYDWKGKKK